MSGINDLSSMDASQLANVAEGVPQSPAPDALIPPTPMAPPPSFTPEPMQVEQGGAQTPKMDPSAPAEPAPAAEAAPALQPMQQLQIPPTPQAQPTPPAMPATPAPVQIPGALNPQQRATASATQRKELANLQYKKAQDPLNAWESFLLGGHHGLVTIGAEAKSVPDFLMGTPHKPSDDWQAQAEQGIPKDVQEGMGYKVGDAVGQMAGYGAAAAGVAALAPVEIPAGMAGAGALGLGALAAEGGLIGGVSRLHESAREGKEPEAGDIATAAAFGAGGGLAMVGASKLAGKMIVKPAMEKLQGYLSKFADHAQTELINAEIASIKAANEALAEGTKAVTTVAKKQEELLSQMQEGLNNLKRTLAPGDKSNVVRGKKGKFENRGPKEYKAVDIKGGADVVDAAVAEEEQAATRGVRKGLGYQRGYNGTDLDKVLKKLPPAMAGPFKAAVDEIAETKLVLEHAKLQVAAYAENAIKLAKTPAEQGRIVKEIEHDLRSGASDELSKIRARLFEDMQALERMTHPGKDLHISNAKHIAVHADSTQLKPTLDKLKGTFTGAAAQAKAAYNLELQAQRRLDGLRDQHKGLFEMVEQHLGEPTPVRVIRGHAKLGKNETAVTVGLQYNPSVATLRDRWLAEYQRLEHGIRSVEQNLKEKIVYKVAHTSRTTYDGASKFLRDAGLVHPIAKGIMLAGALGINAFAGPPAKAAGMDDHDTPEQSIGLQATLGTALVGVILARKYGPAGARKIIKSSRWIFHAMYEDTQALAGMADGMMAKFRGEAMHELDSLANAMNEYRGQLMKMQFSCPDSHALMAKALTGSLTEEEAKLVTPEGHAFAGKIQQLRQDLKGFVSDYRKEFDEHFKELAVEDQLAAREIQHAVHLVDEAFNGRPRSVGGLDHAIQWLFARSAAFNFTFNWKIADTAWLHDMAAYGGMQLGMPSVYAAYAQYTGSPILRGLAQKLHLGGAATEAAQDLNQHANVYTVEAVHNQLAFLGSLHRQYKALAPEQLAKLGIKSANDFAEKVMQMRLPDQHLSRIFEEAALDVSRATGSDIARLNQLGTERAFMFGNITKYTRYMMLDQRLVKENLQTAVQYFSEGKTALGVQRLGRIGHALAIKAQYGGAKAAIPVGAYAALMSNPYTAGVTADVARKIDDASLGLTIFGDLGEHGRWDPVLSPVMGQRLPGFDDAMEAIHTVLGNGADITKMQQVLQSDDPMALINGSKEDDDVKKGQKALLGLITAAGFLVPKVRGLPTRWIRDGIKYWPDVANKEMSVSVPNTFPIGEVKPAGTTKLMGYVAYPDQSEQGAADEQALDAVGELFGRKPGRRQRQYQQATYVKNANKDTEADVPEPSDVGALSEKQSGATFRKL